MHLTRIRLISMDRLVVCEWECLCIYECMYVCVCAFRKFLVTTNSIIKLQVNSSWELIQPQLVTTYNATCWEGWIPWNDFPMIYTRVNLCLWKSSPSASTHQQRTTMKEEEERPNSGGNFENKWSASQVIRTGKDQLNHYIDESKSAR